MDQALSDAGSVQRCCYSLLPLEQLGIVLWKHWLVRIRSTRDNVKQFVLPLVMLLLVWAIYYNFAPDKESSGFFEILFVPLAFFLVLQARTRRRRRHRRVRRPFLFVFAPPRTAQRRGGSAGCKAPSSAFLLFIRRRAFSLSPPPPPPPPPTPTALSVLLRSPRERRPICGTGGRSQKKTVCRRPRPVPPARRRR